MERSAVSWAGPPGVKQYWKDARPPRKDQFGHVTIIGAGIIGLTTAAALLNSGRTVTVLDAAQAVGTQTSFGNGCQLSYSYVAPLAQPSLIAELPELLFSRNAPLRIVPRFSMSQWRWMVQFLAACRPSRATAGSLQLLQLGYWSRAETERWLVDADHARLKFARAGKLVVLPTAQSFRKAQAQMALQAAVGPSQEALSEADSLRIEPALRKFAGRMAGAIYTPSECVIDSYALCQDLESQLRGRGVEFLLGTNVQDFVRRGGRVTRLVTDGGDLPVDSVVLACGPASAVMARRLGFSLPIQPLKGYSITLPVRDAATAPLVSVTDSARKVVYARIGDRLRVAGMAEIGAPGLEVDSARIQELIAHTREAFGDAVDYRDVEPWTGLRPATPTSVPIIGASPCPNVFLNVGHGALGLTLAFGSARRLVEHLDIA